MRLLLFLFTFCFAREWFLTDLEYAKMLFFNPRGISCAKCHGKNGEGKVFSGIKAPDIRGVSFERLKERLFFDKYYTIMPRYKYLTPVEIKALYLYLKSSPKESH